MHLTQSNALGFYPCDKWFLNFCPTATQPRDSSKHCDAAFPPVTFLQTSIHIGYTSYSALSLTCTKSAEVTPSSFWWVKLFLPSFICIGIYPSTSCGQSSRSLLNPSIVLLTMKLERIKIKQYFSINNIILLIISFMVSFFLFACLFSLGTADTWRIVSQRTFFLFVCLSFLSLTHNLCLLHSHCFCWSQ